MSTPVVERLAAAESTPTGYIARSGIESYRTALRGNASAFAKWRMNPMTKLVLGALQDAMLHGPSVVEPSNVQVQYGMSQGIAYAMQLVADPSVLWPGVFGSGPGDAPAVTPVMDFDTPLDDVFGAT